jgi:hypothetical protein
VREGDALARVDETDFHLQLEDVALVILDEDHMRLKGAKLSQPLNPDALIGSGLARTSRSLCPSRATSPS